MIESYQEHMHRKHSDGTYRQDISTSSRGKFAPKASRTFLFLSQRLRTIVRMPSPIAITPSSGQRFTFCQLPRYSFLSNRIWGCSLVPF